MNVKEYNSFESINQELEILALEKELSYQKLLIGYQKLHDNVRPENIKREVFGYMREKVSQSVRELLILAIPYVINILKRKRGE